MKFLEFLGKCCQTFVVGILSVAASCGIIVLMHKLVGITTTAINDNEIVFGIVTTIVIFHLLETLIDKVLLRNGDINY